MPLCHDREQVLTLSALWNIAMNHPNDPEFPSLGIFQCLTNLLKKSIANRDWLLADQNMYIPYYAAHIIGSYTMNTPQFAEKAVKAGVISPLVEILQGKISWVEQRVAARALGHIVSHERTFEAVAAYKDEIINSSIEIALNCLDTIYNKFVCVESRNRVKYHSDLLTRGLGGQEIENRKAEEWAGQLQCWSIYLINCFVSKNIALSLICQKTQFLKKLCGMWGSLTNPSSPAGLDLIRSLCDTQIGREGIGNSKEVIESLCNISRSSDDSQIMAIECLLSLLKDPTTRCKVLDVSVSFLVDLVELRSIGDKSRSLGDAITQTLLLNYHKIKYGTLTLDNKKAETFLEEIWDMKVERVKKEKLMTSEEIENNISMAGLLKKEGNLRFLSSEIKKAVKLYSKALALCPLSMRKQRVVLYSNRAQCYLVLREAECAISDTTRALCLSSGDADGLHGKSLWRRSQGYDMKGLAKESLMDCSLFINSRVKDRKDVEVPYYAARMMKKQMNATWIFADAMAKSKGCVKDLKGVARNEQVIDQKQRRITKLEKTEVGENNTASADGSASKLAHVVTA
ncbi:hypothetical protein ACFE04_023026 [Oxalis oulophora]